MKKEMRNKIVTVVTALILVVGCCFLLQGVIGADRKEKQQKVVAVAETMETASNLSKAEPQEVKETEKTAKAETEMESVKNEGKLMQPSEIIKNWNASDLNIEIGGIKKRPEEIEAEDAAKIGAYYYSELLGIDCAKDTISVELIEHIKSNTGEKVRIYRGEFVHDRRDYCFHIEPVMGKLLDVTGGTILYSDINEITEEENAIREKMREEDKKKKSEPWLSSEEFCKISQPLYWNKITKGFIRENGLNYGKTVNTASVRGYRNHPQGVIVWIDCYLDEVVGETEVLQLGFDIKTKELVYFYNISALNGLDNLTSQKLK